MTDKISAFRISVWPTQSLSVPTLDIWPSRMGTDGILEVWGAFSEQPPRTVAVPPEFYLRALPALDLDDSGAIAAFVETWGTVKAPCLWKVLHAAQGRHEETTRDVDDLREREEALDRSVAEHAIQTWKDVSARLRKAPVARRQSMLEARLQLGAINSRLSCHVDTFRWSVQLLRDMLRIALAMHGKLPFSSVVEDWESPVRPHRLGEWPDPREAARVLAAGLDQGLRSVRTTVRLVSENGTTDEAARGYDDDPPDLYSILCLQMANHIAENAPYHRCENPACGKWFVRQTGGAERGPRHRKGVKYCSERCAKAVSQRRYQERLTSAKRGAGDEGTP